jgi:hypothetical protein
MRVACSTLLLLVVAGFFAAPSSAAGCTPRLSADGVVLGKLAAKRWAFCGGPERIASSGRPVRLLVNPKAFAVVFRVSKTRQSVAVGLRGKSEYMTLAHLHHSRQRVVRAFLVGDRFFYGMDAESDQIRLGRPDEDIEVESGDTVSARSLDRVGSIIRWRTHGAWRRVRARTARDVLSRSCRVPRYADDARTDAGVTTYALRQGYEATIVGCLPTRRARVLTRVSVDPFDAPWERMPTRAPYVVVSEDYSNSQGGGTEFSVFDVRNGHRTATAEVAAYDSFSFWIVAAYMVSASGSLAWLSEYRPNSGPSNFSVTTAVGERQTTLDRGPDIDRTSLRLDGTHLTWTNAGQPRAAELP